MPLPTVRKLSLAIGIATAGIIVAAAIATRVTHEFLDDAQWVARVRDTRATLLKLDNNVDHASHGVHMYLLTGDTVYVRRYRASSDSTVQALRKLRELATIDPSVGATLDALDTVVTKVHTQLEGTLADEADERAKDARVGLVRGPGQLRAAQIANVDSLMMRIQHAVRTLDVHTNGLLAERASTQRTREQLAWFTLLLLGAGSIAVALSARRTVRGDLLRREQAERALRASEAKFAGILEMAADAIISANEQQEIVHFNRGAETIFGYSASEVIGQKLEMLLPERFASGHQSRVKRFAESAESAHVVGARPQVIGRRRDGKEFTAEASVSKLLMPEGMVFTVVLRDITERRRTERREHALAEAGQWLAIPLDFDAQLGAVARMPVGTVGDWCIVDVLEDGEGGAQIRRVASVHRDPVVNARLRAVEVNGLLVDSPERVIDVLRSGAPEIVAPLSVEWLEAHTVDAEHLAMWRELGSSTLLLVPLQVQGRVLGAMTIGSAPGQTFNADDLALAVLLAARAAPAIDSALHLRRAERATAARDRVLGVVSHDLRNFLSAITMSADSLRSGPQEFLADGRTELVQNIVDSAGWMHRLMQDLLDVASIEAGRLSIELDEHAVSPIVEAIREVFAARAHAQGVELRVEIPAGLPFIRVDGQRIMQVLSNLVGNALKYTGAGGSICLSAREVGGEVVFAVQDTGAGITADDLPQVFQRFWHSNRGSATRGTGLGLAIAQGIVTGHGGRIWAESEVGKGSTFSFSVPSDGRGVASPVSMNPAITADT